MFQWVDSLKSFKVDIINIKNLETMSNKLKEGMVTISHETENVNKEIKPIFKKNQMETL